ncbi:hypothetical protein KXD40_007198 [Peronospora effusa]|uniref:Uncharacterized protein n=1 Tax=Peronospora effusa TaxID=542832 RepID=A0A425CBX9_9STRA|nr:hypothetical protein DD237_003152 [Peronospora effusa]UIZ28763.1 hypothetical protein KXD40_007198 [Peronospora effusa]
MTSTATIVDPKSHCSANAELYRLVSVHTLVYLNKHKHTTYCLGCHWCALEFHAESDRHFIRCVRVRLQNVVYTLETLHSLTRTMGLQQQ